MFTQEDLDNERDHLSSLLVKIKSYRKSLLVKVVSLILLFLGIGFVFGFTVFFFI